ncbi:hypothetical protein ACIGO7_35855 [Streptomyces virginiae]
MRHRVRGGAQGERAEQDGGRMVVGVRLVRETDLATAARTTLALRNAASS